ncbi:hypothetical protein BJF89_15570 [Corynebacterium sp. CNJ-954]|nr:hypothetical protein BJF89_15570 [Corynebacterium sp. CNJ-954]
MLMDQSPPDSHCARRSQSESGAALAAGAATAPSARVAMPATARRLVLKLLLRMVCRPMWVDSFRSRWCGDQVPCITAVFIAGVRQ